MLALNPRRKLVACRNQAANRKRPQFRITAWTPGLIAAIALASSLVGRAADPTSKPNIIVLLVDDLGYADLGFLPYAAKDVRTPNIDRLAAGGTWFTDAYVTSPICSASRAAIITGKYQERWGNYSLTQSGEGLPDEELTLPEVLKKLGYATKKIGKNHHGGKNGGSMPWQIGFDEFLGFAGSTNSFVRLSQKDVDELGDGARAYTVGAGPLIRYANGKRSTESFEDAYSTDVFADEAVEYIDRDRDGQPFYLHVAFNAVHHPQYEVNPRYLESWGLTQMMWTPESGLSPADWHRKHGWLGEIDPDGRKRYLACLFGLDEAVGSILDALDAKGIADDTLIFFLSDNGGEQNTYACNGPLHGHKYTLSEGGVRVPVIVRWPGKVAAGEKISEPIMSIDLFPTAVVAAGSTPPDDLDGKSLLPLLNGEQTGPLHEFIAWDQGGGDKRPDWGIRMGNWKLRQVPGSGETRTYAGPDDYGRKTIERSGLTFFDYQSPTGMVLVNLEEQVDEQKNVADENPEKVKDLTDQFDAWRSQMAEPFKGKRPKTNEKAEKPAADPDKAANS